MPWSCIGRKLSKRWQKLCCCFGWYVCLSVCRYAVSVCLHVCCVCLSVCMYAVSVCLDVWLSDCHLSISVIF